jgi:hypothetical protein
MTIDFTDPDDFEESVHNDPLPQGFVSLRSDFGWRFSRSLGTMTRLEVSQDLSCPRPTKATVVNQDELQTAEPDGVCNIFQSWEESFRVRLGSLRSSGSEV